jgi:nickel/cobalt exporter
MKSKLQILRLSRFVLLLLFVSSLSFAHPMGNFSTSHYSGIRIEKGFIEIRYLIDLAEIPTFQALQQNNLIAKPEDAGTRSYVAQQGEALKGGLVLTVNGQPLSLRSESAEVIFPPGAGDLPTMKMAFLYRAAIPQTEQNKAGDANYALYYRDNNFPSRIGWKEIVAIAGSGVTLVSSSVPTKDRSSQLSNYPTDLLNSPPLDLEANVNVRWEPVSAARQPATPTTTAPVLRMPSETKQVAHRDFNHSEAAKEIVAMPNPAIAQAASTPVPTLQANKQATPQNRFTQLMTAKQFGIGFLFFAALIAAGLGALHALEPGHGKTIVAAYLVGSKGTAYHAFLLGLIVTVSHTAGVYALGAVTLYASKYIVPEQLYPWMGAISGLLIAALGSYLFLQRFVGNEIGHSHGPGGHHHGFGRNGFGQTHTHDDGLEHSHDGIIALDHDHGHSHEIPAGVPYHQLLALGITGGIVPCPAALVVLLSAVALNRVGFGLFLIVAFSLGLAAVLIAVGLMMVYARRFMTKFRSEGPIITRWLPLTSAAAITFLGLALAIKSLMTAGILQIRV